jgi:hypothetical protein
MARNATALQSCRTPKERGEAGSIRRPTDAIIHREGRWSPDKSRGSLGEPMDANPTKSKGQAARREFLVDSAASGLSLVLASSLTTQGAENSRPSSTPVSSGGAELEGLRNAFHNPPHSAKPMTRWWWFGGAVNPEEITRGLAQSAALRHTGKTEIRRSRSLSKSSPPR